MPHITEDTVTRLHDRIVKGARLVRRYWPDDSAPHSAKFHVVEEVKFSADGWVTLTTNVTGESRSTKETMKLHYGPDDVIAVVEMKPLSPGSDAETYAHHDDRLILPGGYMDARPGTMRREWDVYAADGTSLAFEATTAEGREYLAERAPEMIWMHHGDGNFTARGNGRHWKIQRAGRNPGYTADAPMTQAWLYALLSRPLNAEEWQEVARDCKSPQEAKEAVL